MPHGTVNKANDPILTTSKAARLLGVAVSTAQLWMESGALESWKTPGGHRRVRLSTVTQLLASRSKETQASEQTSRHLPSSSEFLPLSAPSYPVPPNEAERLLAVDKLNMVATPADPAFDRLTWLATMVTDTPMALITLLTARRQWFKSTAGVDVCETPREWAFCSHAILEERELIVEDALTDARFRDNPLVTGEPHIRFYAGIPLVDAQGFRLGTLCVLDREPRRLREKEIRALRELGAIASREFVRVEKMAERSANPT
ncbi:GAF domain-containing protein [uncultured Oxalicibacterium sp.]|uniref:GAF domain-containing protein n=1 Tax=uncultured Oxalicibacterium sp. TaxID=1168540 RepID=UPI0026005DD6|nr:GAF domain-containing protein [uncultured Oxalicibacterium sp.]